jgi:hypothetical protein
VTRNGAEIRREIRTDKRIPIPEKTAFAGGNTWEIEVHGINDEECCETHETTAVAKDWYGREGM